MKNTVSIRTSGSVRRNRRTGTAAYDPPPSPVIDGGIDRPTSISLRWRHLLRRWPLAVGIIAGVFSFEPWEQSGFTTWMLPVLALLYLIIGTVRRELRRPGACTTQILGLLVFGLLAVVGLLVQPEIGRYIIATGWISHAVWDFAHHRAGRVVPQWYAEFCAVFDLLVAASILLMP